METDLVENIDKTECDLYISDFGSRPSRSGAMGEGSRQVGNWMVNSGIERYCYAGIRGLAKFEVSGHSIGKFPDVLLSVRGRGGFSVRYTGAPHYYFYVLLTGIIEVEVSERNAAELLRDFAVYFTRKLHHCICIYL
jgi:hypothetical protein